MVKTQANLLKKRNFLDRLRTITSTSDILIGLFVSTFFINILGFALPIAIRITYDRIIPHAAITTLTLIAFGVIIAILLETVLRICRNYISAWSDARFEHLASTQALRHILDSRLKEYEKAGSAVYLDYLNSIYILKNFFGGQAIITLIDLPFVILYLWLIFYLAGPLVLIPIVMLCIFALGTYSTTATMRMELDKQHKNDDKRTNYIISVLSGIHTIKSMATEIPMQRRYERLQSNTTNSNYELGLSASKASILGSMARQSTIVLVIAIGAISVMRFNLSVGGLAACIILAARTLQPITRAVDIWSRLQDIKLAEERLQSLSDLPLENANEFPPFPAVQGEIELKNVSFRYDEKSPELYKNLTLKINQNEFIGIKGSNHSGKSTLMWLLTGIITPTSGEILFDGKNISNFDLKTVRSQTAYLPQEGVLFNGTILENITMFRPELSDKAKLISDKLGLTAIVQKLPKGFDTPIGKYAVEALTPGLKQVICLSRGLIEDPKIILFDEANRHLDFDFDSRVKNLLKEFKHRATIIVVSNRPSLLELADTLYTLEDKELRKITK